MDWFLFCLNSISLIGQGILHVYFVCRFTGKPFKAGPLILYLACLSLMESASYFTESADFGIAKAAGSGSSDFSSDSGETILNLFSAATTAAEVAALFGISRLFLGNSRTLSFVSSILAFYVSQLSIGILNSLESCLFPNFIGQPFLYVLVLLSVFAALALCGTCYLLICKWFAFQKGQEQTSIWILVPSCFFFFAVERFILYAAYSQQTVRFPVHTEPGKHLILLSLQVLGLLALLSTLFAYQRICRGLHAQTALASMKRELDAQRTYVAQAQMRYETTRSFRHDIKNHLSVLDGLLKGGNTHQAQLYLKKLDAVTGQLSFPFLTGNPVVDIVLSDKLELARAEGIQTEVSLRFPRECRADDLDLCVIFSNALDNALCACGKEKASGEIRGPAEPFIHITGHHQGDFYMLEFENSCLPGPPPKPGTGLSNIKAVAEKYGGAMSAECSDKSFRLSVLLNISRHPKPPSIQTY